MLRHNIVRAVLRQAQRRLFHSSAAPRAAKNLEDVVIVSAVRTPIGSLLGSLAPLPAPQLGAIVVKEAVKRAGIKPDQVTEALIGNVISANIGQAPARQVTKHAGLPDSTVCTTINKVCSSGLKAVIYGTQSIMLGHHEIVVAGGMESMSNVPFYLPGVRGGLKLGNSELVDGILRDGLLDAYTPGMHMGNCAENTAKTLGITREAQDKFAIESYRRAIKAAETGIFKDEIVPVSVPQRGGKPPVIVDQDEEPRRVNFDKIPTLKPAFQKENGTVTAANSPSLNDGAAALVLMSASRASALGLKPLARILGYADAEQAPIDFTTSPAKALPRALKNAGLSQDQIDQWEINEAFAVVAIANMKLLGLDPAKVNPNGGAVALGHPIGCSGARILTTLVHNLRRTGGKYGAVGICNGGGGASALIVEKL